jgi:hypothetical protein
VLVLVALVAGAPSSSRPLDPASTQPDGTRALVLLLEALGADVDVVRGPVPDDATAALVLQDRLNDEDKAAVRRWVEAGGVLVVSDPTTEGFDGERGRCDPALGSVGSIRTSGGQSVARGDACFEGAVGVEDHGAGSVVRLDDFQVGFVLNGRELEPSVTTSLFMNSLLAEDDNAVLAATLLAPGPGARVAILGGSVGGRGQDTLLDIVRPSFKQAGVQLLVVGLVFVLWRGRRLGRPVTEPQPVLVAGSELVAAMGRLLDARRRPDEAAAALRADLRRLLELRLGVAPGAPASAVADAVALATGLDATTVAAALETTAVATDADLVAVTAQLDRIRSLVLGSRPGGRR